MSDTALKSSAAPATRFRLLNVAQILELTGWSQRTLDRRVEESKFPKPVEGGKRGVGRRWTLAQYERWAKQREDQAESELS